MFDHVFQNSSQTSSIRSYCQACVRRSCSLFCNFDDARHTATKNLGFVRRGRKCGFIYHFFLVAAGASELSGKERESEREDEKRLEEEGNIGRGKRGFSCDESVKNVVKAFASFVSTDSFVASVQKINAKKVWNNLILIEHKQRSTFYCHFLRYLSNVTTGTPI